MKIEKGQIYMTRSGDVVIIEFFDSFTSSWPARGKSLTGRTRNKYGTELSWRTDGSYGYTLGKQHSSDIVYLACSLSKTLYGITEL